MKKLLTCLLAAALLMATAVPALAGVKIQNKTGEKLELKVKGSSTVTRSLESNTNAEAGGSASSITITVKAGGSEVCEGTFSSGDRVVVEKSGTSSSPTGSTSSWISSTATISMTSSGIIRL